MTISWGKGGIGGGSPWLAMMLRHPSICLCPHCQVWFLEEGGWCFFVAEILA